MQTATETARPMSIDRTETRTFVPAGRIRYGIRVSLSSPTTAIGILLAVLFAYLIVAPIGSMLTDGWQVETAVQNSATVAA
jgi:hypothetical protein